MWGLLYPWGGSLREMHPIFYIEANTSVGVDRSVSDCSAGYRMRRRL